MGAEASSEQPPEGLDPAQLAEAIIFLEALKQQQPEGNNGNDKERVEHLANFTLDCSLEEFILLFWEGEEQHVRFLTEKILETDIVLSPWQKKGSSEEPGQTEANIETETDESDVPAVMHRTVGVSHPLPIQLPWLPLSIKNSCHQTISYDASTRETKIRERSKVSTIPFCEPIVEATWRIKEEAGPRLVCEVSLSWECEVFFVLQGQIEYYSKLAMTHFYQLWKPHADSVIEERRRTGQAGHEGRLTKEEFGGPLVSQFWRNADAIAVAPL